ncbi:hypothetical protein QWZ10_00875 [Paracoccus cavernae]|uniref:Uncharacterized protein n=1 Tax=Paracoccus cavernae TaxID=1571207 RepID=A0ABT8D1N3_9RHOB|nr:hypothetical protein [Paracoccus cavernae]
MPNDLHIADKGLIKRVFAPGTTSDIQNRAVPKAKIKHLPLFIAHLRELPKMPPDIVKAGGGPDEHPRKPPPQMPTGIGLGEKASGEFVVLVQPHQPRSDIFQRLESRALEQAAMLQPAILEKFRQIDRFGGIEDGEGRKTWRPFSQAPFPVAAPAAVLRDGCDCPNKASRSSSGTDFRGEMPSCASSGIAPSIAFARNTRPRVAAPEGTPSPSPDAPVHGSSVTLLCMKPMSV